MLDVNLRNFLFNVMVFWVFYEICRWNTAYFPELKYNRYTIIKNRVIAKILIPKAIGRDKIVDRCDYNKLPIIGLISFVICMPINILNLLISFLKLINYKGISDINRLSMIVLILVLILMVINIFVGIINLWDCGRK